MTVRDRIARLYAVHPSGARAERRPGAPGLGQSWLARESARILPQPVTPRTVRRWAQKDRLPPIGVILLEALEREAGIPA